MPHFFVSPKNIKAAHFDLAAEESAHVARVLRKKVGDEIQLFDGVDHSYRGVLEVVTTERVSGRIVAELPPIDAPYFLRLFQTIPKGDTFEWIIEKATELGVSEIVPMQTARSVARVPSSRALAKHARWEKMARAAASQCGRSDVPLISAPLNFEDALKRAKPPEIFLIAWEGEETKTLKSVLSAAPAAFGKSGQRPPALHGDSPADTGRLSTVPGTEFLGPPGWKCLVKRKFQINVMIGPEGGFDPGEVERARAGGAIPVSLGPRILRTETAGIFVASSLLYELGL